MRQEKNPLGRGHARTGKGRPKSTSDTKTLPQTPRESSDLRHPADVESERALLGAMLIGGGQVVEQIRKSILAAMFTEPAHEAIFVACCEAPNADDAGLDTSMLASALSGDASVAALGGPQYLARLAEQVGSAANANHYANKVRRAWQRRQLALCAEGICFAVASDDEPDSEDILRMGDEVRALCGEVASGKHRSRLRMTSLADITPERVRWLWPSRLAHGEITLLNAEPGVSKSILSVDIAARLSHGDAWPLGTGDAPERGRVLIIAGEDCPSRTIRPRLDAAGADLDMVDIVDVRDGDEHRPPDLGDLPEIREAVERKRPQLLIIDPLAAAMPGGTDMTDAVTARRALSPLSRLAREYDFAALIVHHNRKSADGLALHRVSGSAQFAATARIVLGLAPDPDDDEQVGLFGLKNNLARVPETLLYRVVDAGGVPRIEWTGTDDRKADAFFGAAARNSCETPAIAFLRESLANGPRPASEIESKAAELDISKSQLRTAKGRLGVASKRQAGVTNGPWLWSMPTK
ncbi:MAG: hypothetical protein EA380_10225 [Phycisphaeraceae bacterium]|nr:MAG: hypothetical protein EA380_10225 [Phycisphaeraceae bacterium]